MHEGKCLCSEKVHLCEKLCCLENKSRGCKGKCEKHYFSFKVIKEIHICNAKHYCKNKCYYFYLKKDNIFGNKIICNDFCCLEYNHVGKCVCRNPHFHPCTKSCYLYNKSRGCNRECKYEYGHDGNCECNINPENHLCKEKCQLCHNNIECGHVYNHENTNNLTCYKCNENICELSGKGHLCGSFHDCIEYCADNGYCEIESFVKEEEQENKEYKTKLGETIYYKSIKLQKRIKKKCLEKIPPNKFYHKGNHSCKTFSHKCGFQCKQCQYYCIEPINHQDLHNCFHGNIKNSSILINDDNENYFYAVVKKENKSFKLTQGESVQMFLCDEYCKEQGQGHIHYFESYSKIVNEQVKLFENNVTSFIYECKCSYFWENILHFKSNYITKEEKKKFSMCGWKCKYSIHQIPEYCQLPLWHQPIDKMPFGPGGNLGEWISNGHVLKCKHDIGIYTIFLVDSSGSMNSQSHTPNNLGIQEKMNNMMGAAIQAIDSYCKIRAELSPKDLCSLYGFNAQAFDLFENISITNNDIILNSCLERLKPDGFTTFKNAFEKAFDLISSPNFNRNDYIPIIILLTDGLDHGHEETIPYIEKVSIFIIIFYLNRKWKKKINMKTHVEYFQYSSKIMKLNMTLERQKVRQK